MNKVANSDKRKRFRDTLFRREVFEHKQNKVFGNVVLVTPITFSMWCIAISATAIAIILFLYFAHYTKKQEVLGILVPDKGIINLYPKKTGIVIQKYINHGDRVKEGQLLYLISTEQYDRENQGTYSHQIRLIKSQIALQEERIKGYEANINNYKELLEIKVMTIKEYQKYYDDYLSTKLTLEDLKKNLKSLEGENEYAVRSQIDARVTALIANIGDRVVMDKAILSMIPQDSNLYAELLVPTSAIGFVERGQRVLIKYKAYPYQQFGLHEAKIIRIDKSALSKQESNLSIALEEPFYRVLVSINEQTINAYGKEYELSSGMLLDAVILCEKRTLLQWIFDPIYSIKGSLAS